MAKRGGGFPRGGGGMGGGMNMNNLMKQAQKMQEDMAKAQEELADKTVEASVGGGAVTVVISGDKQLQEIKLTEAVVDPDDIEMLQDLIIAAVNEGLKKADDIKEETMGRFTGGLGGLL